MAFEFPPPQKASKPSVGKEGPPLGTPRPSFLLPPPRGNSRSDSTEVVRQVGQQLGQWGDLSEWTADTVRNQGELLLDYGDALETKVEPWAVPTVAPLSQTINRRADASFQMQGFLHPQFRYASYDEYGTRSWLGPDADDVDWSIPRLASVKGRTYLTFLTPAINRVYERLNFMVTAVSSPCRMDVRIFTVDKETLQLTMQVDLPDVVIPLGETVASIEFDPWVATQGSYVCVAILQSGTGNTRSIFGLRDAPRPLSDAVFPRKIGAVHTATGMTSIPSSISGATEVDFTGYWNALYVELSENIGDRPAHYYEPWPDVGAVGRPWVRLTSTAPYSGGGWVGAGGFGYRVAIYDLPLTSENVRVRSSVHTLFDSNKRRATLIVRTTSNGRSGLGLSVINPGSNGRYELIAWTNSAPDADWDTRTVLATVPDDPKVGDDLVVDYLAGEAVFYLNGVERARVSAPAYANQQHRFVGVQTERQGSIFNAWPSPRFGPWSARDLEVGGGEDDETGESGVE